METIFNQIINMWHRFLELPPESYKSALVFTIIAIQYIWTALYVGWAIKAAIRKQLDVFIRETFNKFMILFGAITVFFIVAQTLKV